MQIDFTGKTVLVSGAAHGFGRAMCVAFAERGAAVWGCDILERELAETQAAAVNSQMRVVDLRERDSVRKFVAEAEATSGRVDILIHNAGGVLGFVGKPAEEVTPEEWNNILAVNLTAAFWFAQAVIPGMKRAKQGRIITISSGAGLNISLTGIQAYAAAKAGLIHLTRQLAHELGAYGITVNSIAPGFVRSNANTEKQWQSYGEEGQRRLIENIAMKRLGTPNDIAYGALFLASEYASWITGQVLPIDGGK
ncbi:MAG TPA: SDR family oxidoreductase [Phototrophicaceae bacterium]|nr:SDR family oxidoreductase [Phototrophicaceae bacterium]